MKDPYQVLGVARDASQDDIKKAYRKLAKKHHPDLNPGDQQNEAQFKEIASAYHLLSDPEQRERFDRGEIDAGGAETQRGFYRAHAGAEDAAKYQSRWAGAEGFGGYSQEDLGDILNDLFGGGGAGGGAGAGRRARMQMRGQDVTYTMRVGFLEAASGGSKRITLPDGKGLDVRIPEGATDGQTLRLSGQGGEGFNGGPAGDAYITLQVEPHAFFERKDSNIHMELPVTLQEAVLGARVEVPTIDGQVTLTIPKASNTGRTLRLKGRGVRDRKSGVRGDQYVTLKVVLPDPPDDELVDFLERWGKDHAYDPRRRMRTP